MIRTIFTPLRALLVVGLAGCLLAAGCADQTFSQTVFNPLNLKLPFVPQHEPVRIGIVHDTGGIFDPATWLDNSFGSPWNPFRRRLEQQLGQPVQIEDLKPFQVAAHLGSGRLDFAFLDAKDYLDLSAEFGELGEVIAISRVAIRQGLIVARAGSDIKALADIRGQQFSFGPRGDAVLDIAAGEALEAASVPLSEVNKGLLNEPLLLTHHISSHESALQIASGIGAQVGVIEKSEYDAYPKTGGSVLLRKVAKDDFRVLGKTREVRAETIPEGPFLASADTDPELVRKVAKFLLDKDKNRQAFWALGLSGFKTPPRDIKRELERLLAFGEKPSSVKSSGKIGRQ